jgi:predicted TPR repeat methyltransferase
MQSGQQPPEFQDIGYRWAARPAVDTAEVEAEFAEEAAQYECNLRAWDYRVPHDSTDIFSQYVPRSAKILDAGCGTGLIGLTYEQVGYHNLFGCGLSAPMLEIARAKAIYRGLVRADLCRRLPYDDNAFEAVTCLATLGYVEDAEPTFREFCRVTNPGGIVFVSHRQDLFVERDCLALCDRLEHEGLWQRVLYSDWKPYLPGHPAYMDKLRVGYFVYRVKNTAIP